MSVVLSTITGGPQTGLTSPTYTVVSDAAPANEAKQWSVSALGGTQTGVTVHTISSPFTLTFWRPKVYKLIQWVQGLAGVQAKSIPRNTHKFIVRKGVSCALNVPSMAMITVEVSIPANAETYDPANCRAMMSAAVGALNQVSAGWGDTLVTGSL